MKIAVVGGGINGVMSAWSLAKAGFGVEVFEKDKLIGATSSASTKLLHGGLRYLEQFRFRLVAEGLSERTWWLENAPEHTRTLELILPLYHDSSRSKLKYKTGLGLYDWLAGNRSIGRHRWLEPGELARTAPELKADGLRGGFMFHDGQMNDRALGLWAADRARETGVRFHERSLVEKITLHGDIVLEGEHRQFDFVVNAAGPWARSLLDRSGIASRYQLDLVRGSHLVLDEPLEFGFVLEAPSDQRVCFALPYENQTLLGTTEVRQSLSEPMRCSAEETCYLLGAYNRYFHKVKTERDIVASFAGLRPLVHGGHDATRQSRECALEMKGRLVTVYGGKWTSSRALGQKVTRSILERSRLLV